MYRFKKIENLVGQLIARDFIKFYDYEEKGRGSQFDEMASAKAGAGGAAADDGSGILGGGEKKKIRLKY